MTTNYEKIKNMSKERMAFYIDALSDGRINLCQKNPCRTLDPDCTGCIIKYLESEATQCD